MSHIHTVGGTEEGQGEKIQKDERERGNAEYMRLKFARVAEKISFGVFVTTLALVPLFFWPTLSDFLELPKQTLLIALVIIGGLSWGCSIWLRRHFNYPVSWIHFAPLVLLLGFGISAAFAPYAYGAWIGTQGQSAWSFVSLAALVAWYFIGVEFLHHPRRWCVAASAFLGSSGILALYGLLQAFGRPVLAFEVTQARAFTTVGSLHSLAIFLAVPLVFSLGLMSRVLIERPNWRKREELPRSVAAGLALVSALTSLAFLCVVDFRPAWIIVMGGVGGLLILEQVRTGRLKRPVDLGLLGWILVVGVAAAFRFVPLTSFVRWEAWGRWPLLLAVAALFFPLVALVWFARQTRSIYAVALPGVLGLIAFVFLLFPTPFQLSLPAEISPSASASWQIARQVLYEQPWFGSGVGSWELDYVRYHDSAVNASPFWNTRFDRALSSLLTLLSTVGLVGIAAWIFFLVAFVASGVMLARRELSETVWDHFFPVAGAWLTAMLSFLVYNSNLSQLIAFWFLTAALGALIAVRTRTFSLSSPLALRLSAAGLLGLLIVTVSGGWFLSQRVKAEALVSQAEKLQVANGATEKVLDLMQQATKLQPLSDALWRRSSQDALTAFASLARTAADKDAQQLQQLLTQAINASQAAVKLQPANGENWATLGAAYSQAFMNDGRVLEGKADELAIQNFETAVTREPLQPAYHIELAKIRLEQATRARRLVESSDKTARQRAVADEGLALEAAVQELKRSIELKTDYMPARYYLGVTYERQGKLNEAIHEVEGVLVKNEHDESLAFELALLYARNRESARAENLLEQIVSANPQHANARWYLSSLYQQDGNIVAATRHLEALTLQFPDNAAIRSRLEQLRTPPPVPVPVSVTSTLPLPVEAKKEIKKR